jgi:hypothetical protein
VSGLGGLGSSQDGAMPWQRRLDQARRAVPPPGAVVPGQAVPSRHPARMPRDIAASGGRFTAADRSDTGRLRTAFGNGADLLVDCACYTARDAATLLLLARDAASTVMISSKAVYVDAAGHHANSAVRPDFGGPAREDQPTVAPGTATTRPGRATPRTRSRPSRCC